VLANEVIPELQLHSFVGSTELNQQHKHRNSSCSAMLASLLLFF